MKNTPIPFRRTAFAPLTFAFVACLMTLSACRQTLTSTPAESPAGNYRQFQVLAVNDVYNVEGTDGRKSGGFARLRTLRRQLSSPGDPVLLLHGGDFLFPSSMSSQYKGEQMVDLMNWLDGDANAFDDRFFVTFGNHEFDKGAMKYASMMGQRIAESDFHWLGSNVSFKPEAVIDSEAYRQSLLKHAITTIHGVKVGLYSVTTDMAVPAYASIDGDHLAVSKREIATLRAKGAEVIIALTHLAIEQDIKLLEQLGDEGPDVIFGGHEHNRQHACVAGRCVLKADADIRSATIATIGVDATGKVKVDFRFSMVEESTIAADGQMMQRTNEWIARYEQEYCGKHQLPSNCLFEVIGKTAVELMGEELEIRRFETNLGVFVAQSMINAFDDIKLPGGKKPQIALINSGSLRLNQNIPADSELNSWYLNGIFQYPATLRVIEISGKQLKAVVNHQIEGWNGKGWWLQSAGLAFRHDVANQRATDLSLIDSHGNITPVKDDDMIVAVANEYIANPDFVGDQDGYTMLNLDSEIVYGDKLIDLKTLIIDEIGALHREGKAISPQLPGRICNSTRPSLPCVLD
ncbi:MAG: 2',3'-cyclic-nucleotide 2'-phosphodiesterase (5'-nucleotidase family) [Phenylobacterium sp.]